MTDQNDYERLKEDYKEFPDSLMKPEEWKKLRLIELKKEGRNWSR